MTCGLIVRVLITETDRKQKQQLPFAKYLLCARYFGLSTSIISFLIVAKPL